MLKKFHQKFFHRRARQFILENGNKTAKIFLFAHFFIQKKKKKLIVRGFLRH